MKSPIFILTFVLVLDVISALGVVYARNQSRLLAMELGKLETSQDDGLAEWSLLQIEQAWLSDGSVIEKKAHRLLHMQQPAQTEILVVRP